MKIISKQFQPNRKFVKIFKKSTIKGSYSGMLNIKSKINGHNKKRLQPMPHSNRNYVTTSLREIVQ